MLSRIMYAFRETKASFQRNVTLTAAAILTAAVALLLAGVTFLIQSAFANLLAKWQGGVEMIVYIDPQLSTDQATIDTLSAQLQANGAVAPKGVTFLDQAASYEQAKKVLAGQASLLDSLSVEKMPAQLRVVPAAESEDLLPLLAEQFENDVSVLEVALATDAIKLYDKLSDFVRRFTIAASAVLLIVAVLLIWNTIRIAMFARRREIEVMKLVGATNWFIRVPFMLEGLLQGVLGSLLSAGSLWGINGLWNKALAGFGTSGGASADSLLALRVDDGYLGSVMLLTVVTGAVVGAVAAGIAASRFLDV